jgi:hypothetical protein
MLHNVTMPMHCSQAYNPHYTKFRLKKYNSLNDFTVFTSHTNTEFNTVNTRYFSTAKLTTTFNNYTMTILWKRSSTLSMLMNELAAKIHSANPSITAFGQHLQSDILLHVLYMHLNRWHIHLIFKTYRCILQVLSTL